MVDEVECTLCGREEEVVCVAMAVDGGERREGMKQNNF